MLNDPEEMARTYSEKIRKAASAASPTELVVELKYIIHDVQAETLAEASNEVMAMATFADDNGKRIAETVSKRIMGIRRGR